MALAIIGQDSIRDFAEGNKRARMCDVFYDATRTYLLGQFNWPFARRTARLSMLAESPDWVPEGIYPYALPVDCVNVVDLLPEGSRQTWEIRGNILYCAYGADFEVVILYSREVEDATKFSAPFSSLLAVALAVRLAPPLTQDKTLTRAIFEQFEIEKKEAWATDANVGNRLVQNDNDPNTDTFVQAEPCCTDGNQRYPA